MKRRGWLAAAFVVAGGLGVGAGQAPRQAELQTPTFKVEVEYVEVEASVTDRDGRFVTGLTADDFEVFEDGRSQAIVNFTTVDIPIERYERPLYVQQPIEPDVKSNEEPFNGRVYVMVIDDLHTDFSRTERVRAAARLFIEERLARNDLMAVIHTSGGDASHQEFTNNKRLLLAAADRTSGRKVQSATLSRNDDFFNSSGLRAQDLDEPERAYNAQRTMRLLESVAEWMGSIRGRRKAILFISEGVDYDPASVTGGVGRPSALASGIYDDVRDAVRSAMRSNVSIYGIAPRGLSVAGSDAISVASFAGDSGGSLAGDADLGAPDVSTIGLRSLEAEQLHAQDSLRVLSDETGGFAVVNRNDFSGAFDRLVADNSTYYVLAYYPPAPKRDGKFHRIEVRVKRPGLRVRARQGYLLEKEKPAPKADPNVRSSPEVREALASPIPVSNGVALRVFAAPFKDAAPNGSVVVAAELPGRDLHTEPGATLELSYAAINIKGEIVDGRTDRLQMNALRPETKALVAETGFRLLNRLSLPAGRYQLRLAARDVTRNAVGSVLYDLDVPDFTAEPLSMSGLVLTSAVSARWANYRPDAQLAEVLPGPPTAIRRFVGNDLLALFVEVYDNQAGSPHTVDIETTVTDDEGRVYFTTEEVRDSAELGGRSGGYGYAARVPLVDLSPGSYVLEVEARSRLGAGSSVKRQTEFEVLATRLPVNADAPAAQGEAMRTIEKGVQSSVDRARQAVVRTQAEWTQLWRAHAYDRPAPTVDFTQQTVFAVFMGSRPTAGFSVEIVGVRDEGGTLVVSYRETRPDRGAVTAQIVTSPFHIVAVPRQAGDVRFEQID